MIDVADIILQFFAFIAILRAPTSSLHRCLEAVITSCSELSEKNWEVEDIRYNIVSIRDCYVMFLLWFLLVHLIC